jgi:predicted ATPase
MKLRKVTIRNYLCLREVTLSLSNLTILIGKNGSGKTSILEALYRFFNDFDAVGGGVPSGLTDYYWFDRDTSRPISIYVELELTENEIENIIKSIPEKIRDFIKIQLGERMRSLYISRQIVSLEVGWRTEYLRWGDIELVRDDKPVELNEFLKIFIPKEVTQDFVLYLFTPQEMAGDRLLVNKPKKLAYFSNPQIDALANIGLIRKVILVPSKDYTEWCQEQGYELIERPPTHEEAPFLLEPITADLLNNLLANITTVIKGKFKFIPAARDEKCMPGARNPIVASSVLSSQRELSISKVREMELRWSVLRQWIERFLEKRIEPNPDELLVVENGLRLPIGFLGGGEQEIFSLMWHLLDKHFIYGIEEPENHFHPAYLKKLFSFIKEISSERQIILSTHSPLLVDKTNIENNWIVRREKGETEVKKLEKREDLKFVLTDLGLVPHDIYLKDFIFFVEGETEKEVIPIFGEKLGYKDLLDRIAIIVIGGEGQVKNYLRIWLELLKIYPIEYIVILDKHSEKLIPILLKELEELNINTEKFLVLEKNSIEDYYPVELVHKAFEELFGIKDVKIDPNKPRDKEIEQIIKKHGKERRGWKIDIGKYIAWELPNEQIPKEIEEAFKRAKAILQIY